MSKNPFTLEQYGIQVRTLVRNATAARLYEEALKYEPDAAISSQGALIVSSHVKTGRSPKDKRIVRTPEVEQDIWWGNINIPLGSETFEINREIGRAHV